MNLDIIERKAAETLISLALAEDVGSGDVTTDSLIPPHDRRTAYMITKADGVIAGLEVAQMVFSKLDRDLKWYPQVNDGEMVPKGTIIVRFSASYRAILTGERTALNFLQRMSGIASESRRYADAVKGFKTKILDTRKTLPGFRLLDKYAVKAGGANNHRIGLFDMVMIKDNHIAIAGGIGPAVKTVRNAIGHSLKVEVETTTLDEVIEALEAGADIIMLDNMDNDTMTQAVQMIQGKAETEASGNMSLSRLQEVAATGVDYISVGALTHSVQALDISQRIES
ncbi:nicotinate-nucleotide pyrophosphorylase [carboxylating] [Bacteroidales bacterium 6E]|nr:nicotinate-nucleotide pyrophosphorylase [carboxylating] [Bacteroidales bacterium 6E]